MTLSPKTRKLIYLVAVAVMAVMVALGVTTTSQLNAYADIAARLLAVFVSLLAYFNVNET